MHHGAHEVLGAVGPAGPVDGERFRELMSRFPTGVSVVTTRDPEGESWGMTCSSLVSVCMRPPTLMVCLRTESPTTEVIRRRGLFAVNLLSAGSRPVAERFAAPTADRFALGTWRTSAAGMPWLADGVLARAECRVRQSVEAGDHTAVFGEVVDVSLPVQPAGPPLLHGLRRYATWPDHPQQGATDHV